MKTKDHRLLGEFLLKNTSLFPGKKERTFFLFGCVEPDYNPFTYLLGFFIHPFRGHHVENSARYLGWLESISRKRGLKRPLTGLLPELHCTILRMPLPLPTILRLPEICPGIRSMKAS